MATTGGSASKSVASKGYLARPKTAATGTRGGRGHGERRNEGRTKMGATGTGDKKEEGVSKVGGLTIDTPYGG